MKVLIATHNNAKFIRYKTLLKTLKDLEFYSLNDLDLNYKVEEPFNNVKDNAIHKCREYSKSFSHITIAIDESLRTNFLNENEQQQVYVRRLGTRQKEATDKEMLEYWRHIIEKYSDVNKRITWKFAIAIYNPKNGKISVYEVIQKVKVTNTISEKTIEGYPMSSFMVFEENQKVHSELTDEERLQIDKIIFKNFISEFSKWISKQ